MIMINGYRKGYAKENFTLRNGVEQEGGIWGRVYPSIRLEVISLSDADVNELSERRTN